MSSSTKHISVSTSSTSRMASGVGTSDRQSYNNNNASTTTTSTSTTTTHSSSSTGHSSSSSSAHNSPEGKSSYTHWIFLLVGVMVTLGVVGGVVALEYTNMTNAVAVMVTDRAETILDGAVNTLLAFNDKSIANSKKIQHRIFDAGNTSTSPVEAMSSMVPSLRRAIELRAIADPHDMGYSVAVMGPPVAPTDYPPQDPSVQNQCTRWCRRPNDPAPFTEIAHYAIFRDDVIGAARSEFRRFLPEDNFKTGFISMKLVNRSIATAPTWARSYSDKTAHVQLQITEDITKYRINSTLPSFANGSSFDGTWTAVAVTSSPTGRLYYFFAYYQAFINPRNNLTVILTNFISAFDYQRVLVSYAGQVNSGGGGHLILVDGLARVIGYNHDPFGDSRLENCTIASAPNSVGRQCEDFFAVSHPSVFVRSLFGRFQEFILLKNSPKTRQMWFVEEGVRYLLVVKPIIDEGGTRIIASFCLREEDVIGSLKRDAIAIAVVSAFFVSIACIVLISAGFWSLRGATQTVVLVAKLAGCIGRYDVEGAKRVIDRTQQRRCFKTPTPMESQFSTIIHNLQVYRPFLPASMLTPITMTTTNVSKSNAASRRATKRRGTAVLGGGIVIPALNGVVAFNGSILLIDVGNLPIASTVSYRQRGEVEHIINTFLQRTLDTVSRHGGVAEVVRANQILASFNVHSATPIGHQDAACLCAVDLQKELVRGKPWGTHKLNIAICVTSGTGLAGSSGTATTQSRVITGEPVDLIWRLPALQRMLGAGILTVDATVQGLSGVVLRVPVDVVVPSWQQSDRSEEITVYEVLPHPTTTTASSTSLTDSSSAVVDIDHIRAVAFAYLYRNNEWKRAASAIAQLPQTTTTHSYPLLRLGALCLASMVPHTIQRRYEVPWEQLEGKAFHKQHNTIPQSHPTITTTTTTTTIINTMSKSGRSSILKRAGSSSVNTYDDSSLPITTTTTTTTAPTPTSTRSVNFMKSVAECGSSGSALANSMLISWGDQEGSGGMMPSSSSNTMMGASFSYHVGDASWIMGSSSFGRHHVVNVIDGSSIVTSSGEKYYPTTRLLGKKKKSSSSTTITTTLAIHEKGGLVAMKHIPLVDMDPIDVDTIVQEVEYLASLSHPHIASYITYAFRSQDDDVDDSGFRSVDNCIEVAKEEEEDDDDDAFGESTATTTPTINTPAQYTTTTTLCIMSEYLPAGSLDDLIRSIPPPVLPTSSMTSSGGGGTTTSTSTLPPSYCVPLPVALRIGLEVAQGLEFLHSRHPPIIVYPNLLTKNVVMTCEGRCRLLGFGLTVVANGSKPGIQPQQRAVLPSDDVFAFAELMIQVVLGKNPRRLMRSAPNRVSWGGSAATTTTTTTTGNATTPMLGQSVACPAPPTRTDAPLPPTSLLPLVSYQQLSSLLSSCLNTDPSQRPTSSRLVETLKVLMADFS